MNENKTHKKLSKKIQENPEILNALPPLYQRAAALLFPELNQSQK